MQKIPYMLVTGDREAAEGAVSVRSRSAGDMGSRALDTFIADALEEIRRKDQVRPEPAEPQGGATNISPRRKIRRTL